MLFYPRLTGRRAYVSPATSGSSVEFFFCKLRSQFMGAITSYCVCKPSLSRSHARQRDLPVLCKSAARHCSYLFRSTFQNLSSAQSEVQTAKLLAHLWHSTSGFLQEPPAARRGYIMMAGLQACRNRKEVAPASAPNHVLLTTLLRSS